MDGTGGVGGTIRWDDSRVDEAIRLSRAGRVDGTGSGGGASRVNSVDEASRVGGASRGDKDIRVDEASRVRADSGGRVVALVRVHD